MKKQFLAEELQRLRLRVFIYKLAKEGVDNAIPLSLFDDSIRVPHIFIRLHKITRAFQVEPK
jgi:hypothetical protein